MKIPPTERHLLSKSTFMMGQQCSKRLWLYRKRPDLAAELSASQEMVFEKGTDVGKLARELFRGGKDASPIDPFHYPEAIQQTYKWVQAGEAVIYEAAFQSDGVMAALDILVNKKGKWNAYEVKSSVEVKDQHIRDAALQYYVMTNSGLLVNDIYIVHINKEYTRKGALDLKLLFTMVSVRKEVLALQKEIQKQIENYKKILQLTKEPVNDIGPHCSDPYDCEYTDHCWKHIPEVSVFNLTRMRGDKKFELYYKGIIEFHHLPDGFSLTAAQELQVKAHRENYTHIEVKMMKEWLKQLKYPLYFMDFETFTPAAPLYDNTRPYQQIPFQFSVHVQSKPGTELEHYAYLGKPENDPRPEFLKQLIVATKGKGCILVYNKAFEATRLKELQEDFPKYSGEIDKILNRLIDLMEPFQKKWYYTASMNGSYRIKSVLPALVPEMSYDEMEIGEGGTAMAAFEGLLKMTDEAEKKKIRNALLEYCKLDTMAMVKILEKLRAVTM
jgi:CRISPR/Cas system-associated exonuclease Cas4 (RecB family)